MEYNKRNNLEEKLNPLGDEQRKSGGDNSEYQEEAENDVEDDDEVYLEQNFTDVMKCFHVSHARRYQTVLFVHFRFISSLLKRFAGMLTSIAFRLTASRKIKVRSCSRKAAGSTHKDATSRLVLAMKRNAQSCSAAATPISVTTI